MKCILLRIIFVSLKLNKMRVITLLTLLIFSTGIKAQVAPFVTTTWNQTCYYNAQTPTVSTGGSCGRAYTGCNATALAMICKYYNWPANGIGGSHCNSNFTTSCVNFGSQTYSFAATPNNVTSANAEVAKLMYNLGVACDMQWSNSNSTSFFDGTILKKYFSYSPKMYSTASFMFATTADLIVALKAELNAGRPVFAKGGGHFYLIDGYDASNNFHTNFGWSGTYNGYYAITSVTNAAGNFTPGNFLFNIKPLTGNLEFGKDTVVVGSGTNINQGMDFTSLLNFSVSTTSSWINLNLTTGTPGFYDYSNGGTFNTLLNNGGVRYGSIIIQNGTSTKTLVVKQDASPLIVNPMPLTYSSSASSQMLNVSYFSWGTWTVTTPNAWLSLSVSGGTGNGNFSVTTTANTSTVSRNGYVIVKGGLCTDSIPVTQAAFVATVATGVQMVQANDIRFNLYPNPSSKQFELSVSDQLVNSTYSVTDELGRILIQEKISSNKLSIDVSSLNVGIYYLKIDGISKKIIVLRN